MEMDNETIVLESIKKILLTPNKVFVTSKEIAEDTGLDYITVLKYIGLLESGGYIIIEEVGTAKAITKVIQK